MKNVEDMTAKEWHDHCEEMIRQLEELNRQLDNARKGLIKE
jgi:hypothetical protein